MFGKMPFDANADKSHFRLAWAIALWGSTIVCVSPVTATPSDLCLAAARSASAKTDVPAEVLLAIAQTETGRSRGAQVQPWPWTVNVDGAGHWFDDAQTAYIFANAQFERGERSFDVGCFQLNYRWHGENFTSIEAMFDPEAGANYAAQLLSRLYAEKGDWSAAAGAYHSRTPEYARRYRARFDRFYVDVKNEFASAVRFSQVDPAQASIVVPRQNMFPLLQGGMGRSLLGSLVPLSSGS